MLLVDSMASGRERPDSGKASHRGHGGHRGGLELEGARLLGEQIGFWAGKTRTGESLTEYLKEELIKATYYFNVLLWRKMNFL
jgi:hypothetical protein